MAKKGKVEKVGETKDGERRKEGKGGRKREHSLWRYGDSKYIGNSRG